jgi:hypothetical protein
MEDYNTSMETVHTSEIMVNFYETTRHKSIIFNKEVTTRSPSTVMIMNSMEVVMRETRSVH